MTNGHGEEKGVEARAVRGEEFRDRGRRDKRRGPREGGKEGRRAGVGNTVEVRRGKHGGEPRLDGHQAGLWVRGRAQETAAIRKGHRLGHAESPGDIKASTH